MKARTAFLAGLMLGHLAAAKADTAAKPAEYDCVVTQTTVHNIDGPSWQRSDPHSLESFTLRIDKTTAPDKVWCHTERISRLQAAYCALPYETTIGNNSFFGEDAKLFRGYFPYDYLEIFEDKAFLWSSGLHDGVMLRSGRCH